MNTGLFLLKDPLFIAAFLVFLGGLSVLFWVFRQFRTAPPAPIGRRYSSMPAQNEPGYFSPSDTVPHDMDLVPPPVFMPPPPAPAASSSLPVETDDTLMYSVIEERFSELAKRIAWIENERKNAPKGVTGAENPATTAQATQFAKRLEELEAEIGKIKTSLSDIKSPAGGAPQDMSAISEKVEGIQRILESLTAESEVSKFS